MLQNDVLTCCSSKNSRKTRVFEMLSFTSKSLGKLLLWCFRRWKIGFEKFFSLRNNFDHQKVVKNKQKSTTYVCYIGRYSIEPWNKRFVLLFQNLKAFSIFKLRPIPSGSESFKPILEASRSLIFDPDLSFLKKNYFFVSYYHFYKQILKKISLKTRKESKKIIFLRFSQNGSMFDIWSSKGS